MGFIIGLAIVLVAESILMAIGGFKANSGAAVGGLFVAIVLFGLHRFAVIRMSADGWFSEWKFVRSDRVAAWLTRVCWLIGAVNVYWAALELTR